MATPVGPAPRDPNDPDFWDWNDGDLDGDDIPTARRHPARAVVAAIVVLAMIALVIAGSL